MMIEAKTKFKIDIFKNKNHDGTWNLGICLIHYFEETYIRIDFFSAVTKFLARKLLNQRNFRYSTSLSVRRLQAPLSSPLKDKSPIFILLRKATFLPIASNIFLT